MYIKMDDDDESRDSCGEIEEIKVKDEPVECDLNIDDKKIRLDAVESGNVKLEKLNDKKHVQKHEILETEDCIISWKVEVEESRVCVNDFNQDCNTKHYALLVTENIEGITANGDILYNCPRCTYTSNSRRNYRKHVQRHDGIKKFVCTVCQRRFQEKGTLQRHILTHGGQKPFKCSLCDYGAIRKECIDIHMRDKHTETGEKRYKCPKCEYKTNYKCNWKQHEIVHEDARLYECEICNKQFKRASDLKYHGFVHDEEKRYQCAHCDYETNIRRQLVVHLKNKHLGSKSKECDFNQDYNTKHGASLVTQNIKDVTAKGDILHHCPRCTYTSHSRLNYKRHVQRHDGIKKFVCTICERGFYEKWNLQQHMFTHGGKRVFECSLCDYRTVRKVYVNRHMQSKHAETGEKRYKCPKCEYRTNYTNNLNKHQIVHEDRPQYECEICNRQFKRAYQLKSHAVVHDEVKRYQRAHCDYKSKTKRGLAMHLNSKNLGLKTKHRRLKSKNKKYECSKCTFQTAYSSSLNNHFRKHLKSVEEEHPYPEGANQTDK